MSNQATSGFAERLRVAQDFLDGLYGQAEGGYLSLFVIPGEDICWFPATDLKGAALQALRLSGERNVYFGIGLHPRPLGKGQRGVAADVCSIPGMWVEIDYGIVGHKATNLPPDQSTALGLLNLFPYPPSSIVASGHGIHAWWLFKEPLVFNSDEERNDAHTLIRRFQRWFQEQAKERRWKVDSTTTLAQVLRPPGTWNRKPNLPPVLVEMLHQDESSRYHPSHFDSLLPQVEEYDVRWEPRANGDFPLVSIKPILDGCAWMRHCRDDAKTLTEPEWYAALGILGRCDDGASLAHEWSSPHPDYDRAETDKKLVHATKAAGPRTCANIRADLGQEQFCSVCPSWGKIKSPINLADLKITISPRENEESSSTEDSERVKGLGDEVLARNFAADVSERLMYVDGGQYFFYQRTGIWIRRNRDYAERMLFDWMDEQQKAGSKITITDRKINGVLDLAKNRLGPHDVDELDANSNWIALRNTVYDLATSKPRQHAPKNMLTQIHPFDFDADAQCGRWMQFLDETLVEEDGETPCLEWHGLLQEFAGYLLVPTARAQTSMFWLGGGANGKGVAQKVLERLVGEPYVAAVLINKLDDPYHLADLHGKLFATISEIDRRALREKGQMLKAIIGGDRVSGRRLRENVFAFTPTVRILVTCNQMPRTDDVTEGYFRRIMPMLWRRHFEDDKQDPLLAETLRGEASGIFNWALVGLRRLEARGWRFELPEASKRLLKAYRTSEDNFRRFIEEQCASCIQPEGLHTETFYQEYCRFCTDEGEKDRILRKQEVRERLRLMGLNEGRPRVEKVMARGFFGLKLDLKSGVGESETEEE